MTDLPRIERRWSGVYHQVDPLGENVYYRKDVASGRDRYHGRRRPRYDVGPRDRRGEFPMTIELICFDMAGTTVNDHGLVLEAFRRTIDEFDVVGEEAANGRGLRHRDHGSVQDRRLHRALR